MNVNSAFVYSSNDVASDDEGGCVNDTQSSFMSIMLSVVPLRIAISVRDLQYTGAQIRCFIVHHCKFVYAKCEQF
jgi:hypothetical protein